MLPPFVVGDGNQLGNTIMEAIRYSLNNGNMVMWVFDIDGKYMMSEIDLYPRKRERLIVGDEVF